MNFLLILAQAAEATSQATGEATTQGQVEPPWYMSPMTMLVIVAVFFYLFVIRGKRKQDTQRKDMLSNLKKGDRIQTIGGIMGTVVEAREQEVVVKVDETSNTKMRFSRSAIHRVIADEPDVKKG